MQLLKALICVLACICFVACSTTQAINIKKPVTAAGSIHPGDNLLVTKVNGAVESITVTQVNDREIQGKRSSIRWSEIKSIERSEVSTAKTAGLGVGVIAALLLASVAFGAYVVSHGMD